MIDQQTLKGIVAIGLIVIMAASVIAIVLHRTKTDKGFGYRFIQVLAVVEVVPSVLLLATLDLIKGEAAAALVGTVIGYAFGLKTKTKKESDRR
jgi:hypothetical protein